MADEDFDLKEALVRSLRENGILPKLQAQLKAAVYLALEKHNYGDGLPPANPRIRSLLSSEDGLITASLLADFLTQMDLNNTTNVLKHELQMDQLSLLDRESLCSMLGLHSPVGDVPIITSLLEAHRSSKGGDDSRSSGSPLSHDIIHTFSRSPTEFNRISNGNGSQLMSESNYATKSAQPSSNDRNHPHASVPHIHHDSKNGDLNSDAVTVSGRAKNHAVNVTDSSTKDQTIRANPDGIISPLRPGSKTSPRDQEYGDDFESPRSQESHASLSGASRSGDMNSHEKNSISKNNVDQKSVPSFLVDMRTNQVVRMDGTSSPLSGMISESSLNCSEKLISRSGTSSPSVIRVYAPAKRRTPSNEASSDVDDDDEDDIPEALRRDDSESDTIDQTVDSEQSLKLDFIEDIQSSRHSITPTPAL